MHSFCVTARPSLSVLNLRFQHDRRGTGDASVFAHAPEVHHHECRGDDRNRYAVPDVGAQQGIGIHDRAAQQPEANVIERRHPQHVAEGAVVTQQRRRPRHVGSNRYGPETELIVRQQVAGEAEQQGQDQQKHSYHPVELPRRLVGSREKDAEHVQLDHDHHEVRAPAVHVAQQLAEGHVVLEVEDVAEGHNLGGVVVKHEQRAGEDQRDVDVERHAAHAPGVFVGHRIAVDFGRMQVQEDVGEDSQSAAAGRLVVLDAQHRFPQIGLFGLLEGFELLGRAVAYGLGVFEQRGQLAFAVLAVAPAGARGRASGRRRTVFSVWFSHD